MQQVLRAYCSDIYCGTHFEYKIALPLMAQLIQFPNHESTSATANFFIDDCSIDQDNFDHKVKWVSIIDIHFDLVNCVSR